MEGIFTKNGLSNRNEREHQPTESEPIVLENPKKTTMFADNNRTLLVGPRFLGKTYLTLEILSRMPDRDFYIITKSPPKHYSCSEITIKEMAEVKHLNEYENAIKIFGYICGSSNSRYILQFFIRIRQNSIHIYYLSQYCFDLRKRNIRNKSNKTILLNQTLKDIENK